MQLNGIKKMDGSNFLRGLCILLALTLTSCNSRSYSEKALGLNIEINEKKLSNGLTVIMAEDHTFPVVSYQTWVKAGSVDEIPGKTGLAHLFEHLMFKGTKKFGPKAFFEQLETQGAAVNAYTVRDFTVFHEDFTPNLLSKVIEMEGDRLQGLILNDKILDTEKNVVLEERRLRTENSPQGRMQEVLWQLAFDLHPYRTPVIGYMDDLIQLSVKDLQDFYKTYYTPSNVAIVLAGDFKQDEAMDLIKKHYGDLPKKSVPKRNFPVEPAQTSEHRYSLYDDIASQQFMQAYPASDATNPDSFALDVLANILFEGTSSRAHHLLVEEKQVALSIDGSAFTPTYPGIFIISGTMSGANDSSQAESLLNELILDVQKNGVKEEEVKTAVNQLTMMVMDGVRTPHGLAQLLGTVYTILGDASKYADDLEKYTKITRTDVQRVAKDYLKPNQRTVVVMYPKKSTPPTPIKKGASDESI